jgi:predicted nucleic acid-binding protein
VKPPQPIFVDTLGWLAYGHRRDAHHAQVKELLAARVSNRTAIHTSDYVLDELITLLFRRETYEESVRFLDGLFADATRGTLQIQRVTAERFHAALELRKRFRDKPDISFTDLTSMAIMRELQITVVVTEGGHFRQVGMGFEKLPE